MAFFHSKSDNNGASSEEQANMQTVATQENSLGVLSEGDAWAEQGKAAARVDRIAPKLVSSSPTDNAKSVAADQNIVLTFSEPVLAGSGDIVISGNTGDIHIIDVADASLVSFSGNTVTINPTSDLFTDSQYNVQIGRGVITDVAGNAYAGISDATTLNFTTSRTGAPTSSIVVADSALKAGETSLVTITFSEAVQGFDNADLAAANGSLTPVSSKDGGVTWTTTFTPTANLTAADNAIAVDNTGVQDSAGNAGIGHSESNHYAIDTQSPFASSIVLADSALKAGETSRVTIIFSEPVKGFSNADLVIANGSLTPVSSKDGGVTWTAMFTPSVDLEAGSNLITLANNGVRDLAGNTGVGVSQSNSYAIDTLRPTASIAIADTALKLGDSSAVSITFNEVVQDFDNTDLAVAGGSLSPVASADGGVTCWNAVFTPTAGLQEANNTIALDNSCVADLAGNAGVGTSTSNNYTVDTLEPALVSSVPADNATAVAVDGKVSLTFSEPVAAGSGDIVIRGNTGDTHVIAVTDASQVSFNGNMVNIDPAGNLFTDSRYTVQMAGGVITDVAGNAYAGISDATTLNFNTVRTGAPTSSIVVADTALKAGESTQVTIRFSEAVKGFDNADLVAANGSLTPVSSKDGGVTWTTTFTPTANLTAADNAITVDNTGVQDLAGNAGIGHGESNHYAIDTQRPTAAVVVADAELKAGETSLVTFTFSEAVQGFDNSDLSIANGSLSPVSLTDGGSTWTAIFTPAANVVAADNAINLDKAGVQDLAGNAGVGHSESNHYAINTQRPTVAIAVADTALRAGESTSVTFTFSEAVQGFDNSDLTIANGSLTPVSSKDGGIPGQRLSPPRPTWRPVITSLPWLTAA